MKSVHDSRSKRVAEPVQVYLDLPDRARLERLSGALNTTKSDVLRRALEALEEQLTSPESNPALRIIGLGATYTRRPSTDRDVATEHDSYLAEHEIASWKKTRRRKRGS